MIAVSDETWMSAGECVGVDTDLWFPERGGDVKQAKAVCFACPVRLECLKYALDNKIRHGVWGGLSERQRRGKKSVTETFDRYAPKFKPHTVEILEVLGDGEWHGLDELASVVLKHATEMRQRNQPRQVAALTVHNLARRRTIQFGEGVYRLVKP